MNLHESHCQWVEASPKLSSMEEIENEKSRQGNHQNREKPEQLKCMNQIEVGEHQTCAVCNAGFLDIDAVDSHVRVHQNQVLKFKCALCQREYSRKRSLKRHFIRHTAEKLVECQFCDKKLFSQPDLNKHLHVHSKEKPFKCDICDKAYPSLKLKTRHQNKHDVPIEFWCKMCSACFFDKEEFHEHLLTYYQELGPFCCTECGKVFGTKTILSLHLYAHITSDEYKCKICHKRFAYKSTLTRHEQVHVRKQDIFLEGESATDESSSSSLGEKESDDSVTVEYNVDVSLTCDDEIESLNVHKLQPDTNANVENNTCVDFSSCDIEIKEEVFEEFLQDNVENGTNNVISSTKSCGSISEIQKCHDNGGIEDYECAKCEKHFTEKNLYISHLVTHSVLDYACMTGEGGNSFDEEEFSEEEDFSSSGKNCNSRLEREATCTERSSDQDNMEVEKTKDSSYCGAQFESSHAPHHQCGSNVSEYSPLPQKSGMKITITSSNIDVEDRDAGQNEEHSNEENVPQGVAQLTKDEPAAWVSEPPAPVEREATGTDRSSNQANMEVEKTKDCSDYGAQCESSHAHNHQSISNLSERSPLPQKSGMQIAISCSSMDFEDRDAGQNEEHSKEENLLQGVAQVTEDEPGACVSEPSGPVIQPNERVHGTVTKQKKYPARRGRRRNRARRNDPFLCRICGVTFANIMAQTRHCKLEHQGWKEPKESLTCPECQKEWTSRSKLEEHVISHMNDNNAKGVSNESLEQFLTSHKFGRYSCTVCGKMFAFKSSLRNHMKGHPDAIPVNRTRACSILTSASETLVKEGGGSQNEGDQMMARGSEITPHKCETCGEMFPSAEKLDIHVKTHTSSRFPCSVCGRAFGFQSLMVRHMKTHTQRNRIKLYRGSYESFSEPGVVTQEGVKTDLNVATREETSPGSPVQCLLKTETQPSREDYLHENTQNLYTGKLEDSREEDSKLQLPQVGSLCGENGASGTEGFLQDRDPATNFMCPLCVLNFQGEAQLNTHILRRHCSIMYHFKCPVCDKLFADESVVQIHVQFHLKSKFNCMVCGRVLMSKVSLDNHARKHLKRRKHKCQVCGKTFPSVEGRRSHMKTHAVRKVSLQVQRGFDVVYDGADELYEPMCELTNDTSKQTQDPLGHTGKDCNGATDAQYLVPEVTIERI